MWHLEFIPPGQNHWFVSEPSKVPLKRFQRGEETAVKRAVRELASKLCPNAQKVQLVWKEEVLVYL